MTVFVYLQTNGGVEKPADPLKWIELVLDNRGELCEMNRLPGENEVSPSFSSVTRGKNELWRFKWQLD